MNCLGDLKDFFVEHGYKIKDYSGVQLVVGKDRYGMILGDFYKNGVRMTKKELVAEIKKNKPKKKSKKND